jgi:hypothetical protein
MFGGIPSTKEAICPSISNVLVAALEGCANAVFDIVRLRLVIYDGISNSKKEVKTR